MVISDFVLLLLNKYLLITSLFFSLTNHPKVIALPLTGYFTLEFHITAAFTCIYTNKEAL